MNLPVDLRSDTVTKPTPAMRQAMAAAEVGDDVAREDPTVNRLEALCAGLYGMEASLFVPSGTMANQVAIKTWTRPGDELIVEMNAHCYNLESAAIAALSGVQVTPVEGKRGIMSPEQVEARIRPKNIHHGPTTLIAIENTHNRGGGSIYPVETVRGICEVARRHGIRLHLDGAQIGRAHV
jgi:threonine aldolase